VLPEPDPDPEPLELPDPLELPEPPELVPEPLELLPEPLELVPDPDPDPELLDPLPDPLLPDPLLPEPEVPEPLVEPELVLDPLELPEPDVEPLAAASCPLEDPDPPGPPSSWPPESEVPHATKPSAPRLARRAATDASFIGLLVERGVCFRLRRKCIVTSEWDSRGARAVRETDRAASRWTSIVAPLRWSSGQAGGPRGDAYEPTNRRSERKTSRRGIPPRGDIASNPPATPTPGCGRTT
jgi:hypothetical protein